MFFCTIFDSNYLDKALVMLKSLYICSPESIVYVLAFDDKSEEFLDKKKLKNVVTIGLKQVETPEITALKERRSKAEYIWTFTPVFIEYVMENFKVEYCTYIDVDMYFYSDPQILLDELVMKKKSVGLMEHRFRNTANGRKQLKNGKYCVEFNTFKNDFNGRRLLSLWKELCIEECSLEKTVGDQGYISNWGEEFPNIVHEYQNFGGGVAPWNLSRYRLIRKKNKTYVIENGRKKELIFYHFQGMAYQGNDKVKMGVICIDNGFVPRKYIRYLYYPYLQKLEAEKLYLKKDFDFEVLSRGRIEFAYVKFNLKGFLKSVQDRMSRKEYWEILDLMARIVRKKQDIVILHNKVSKVDNQK